MLLRDKMLSRSSEGKAILAANFYNLETLKSVLIAAKSGPFPVILQLTESSIDYMGLATAVRLARQGLEEYEVEGWLHLDHGGSVELVERALKAGFDSVMIDASEETFDVNVETTSKVVEMAKRYDACVEAELGYVAKLGQSMESTGFTRPEEARQFVEATGVDALAIAIGTAHGFYMSEPKLQLDLLDQIRAVTHCTLVLHGSSGVPDEAVKAAISGGIGKVNLATEIKNAFMKGLQCELLGSNQIDLRKVFPKAMEAVVELVSKKFLLMEGRSETGVGAKGCIV